jgi:hypothetical protein
VNSSARSTRRMAWARCWVRSWIVPNDDGLHADDCREDLFPASRGRAANPSPSDDGPRAASSWSGHRPGAAVKNRRDVRHLRLVVSMAPRSDHRGSFLRPPAASPSPPTRPQRRRSQRPKYLLFMGFPSNSRARPRSDQPGRNCPSPVCTRIRPSGEEASDHRGRIERPSTAARSDQRGRNPRRPPCPDIRPTGEAGPTIGGGSSDRRGRIIRPSGEDHPTNEGSRSDQRGRIFFVSPCSIGYYFLVTSCNRLTWHQTTTRTARLLFFPLCD